MKTVGNGVILTAIYTIMLIMILGVGIISDVVRHLSTLVVVFIYTVWFGLCMALALLGSIISTNVYLNIKESLYDNQ